MADINQILVGSTTYDIRDKGYTSWTATVTTQTWSRLCYITAGQSTVGGNFLISIGATRGSVVYNGLYVIEFNHNGSACARIIKLAGGNYSNYKIRVVAANNGYDCYVELYDNANTVTGTQSVACVVRSTFIGSVTAYTTYTAGSIPTSYTAYEMSASTSYTTQIDGSFNATTVYQNGTQVATKGVATGGSSPATDSQGAHTHTIGKSTDSLNNWSISMNGNCLELTSASKTVVTSVDANTGSNGAHTHTVNSHTHTQN